MSKDPFRDRPARRPPFSIKTWEVGINLRDCRWNRREAEAVARRHHLEDGEAVILFNNAREFGGSGAHPPKSRLYWKVGGQVVTLIPPIEVGNRQVSYQLLLNEWIRKTFNCAPKLVEAMNGFDGELERRLAAKAAARRRKAA